MGDSRTVQRVTERRGMIDRPFITGCRLPQIKHVWTSHPLYFSVCMLWLGDYSVTVSFGHN